MVGVNKMGTKHAAITLTLFRALRHSVCATLPARAPDSSARCQARRLDQQCSRRQLSVPEVDRPAARASLREMTCFSHCNPPQQPPVARTLSAQPRTAIPSTPQERAAPPTLCGSLCITAGLLQEMRKFVWPIPPAASAASATVELSRQFQLHKYLTTNLAVIGTRRR